MIGSVNRCNVLSLCCIRGRRHAAGCEAAMSKAVRATLDRGAGRETDISNDTRKYHVIQNAILGSSHVSNFVQIFNLRP